MSLSQSHYPDFPEFEDPFASWPSESAISLSLQDPEQLDSLIERGFDWEESVKLISLREHVYDNAEVKQRLADDAHMQFARWLYQHGELSDF